MRRAALFLFVATSVALGCAESSPSPSAVAGAAGVAGSTQPPPMPAGSSGAPNAAGSPGVGGFSGTGGSVGGAAGTLSGVGGAGASGTAGSAGSAGASGVAGGAGAGGVSGSSGGRSNVGGASGAAGETSGPLEILVFSRTTGFRHDSIPDGTTALQTLATAQGWNLVATEDPSVFDDERLAPLDVVVFLSTTGEVLDTDEQAAFERFIRAGGGFVGIHSASDTEYDWPFYGALVGAYFREHPTIQQATLHVEDGAHPTMTGLPATWERTDEWYSFTTNPRENVDVLMTLDEASYEPGTSAMGGDHPITWCHDYEGGRAFYTALGHTKESYSEPLFTGLLGRAIAWAARR